SVVLLQCGQPGRHAVRAAEVDGLGAQMVYRPAQQGKHGDTQECAGTMQREERAPVTMSLLKPHHQAPRPRSTVGIVFNRISRSNQKDQVRIYSRSSRTHSSKSRISLRPEICHRQVMPGFTASFCFCQSVNWQYSVWSGGLGPTRLMSPTSTLHSCGSSSRLYFRSSRPTRVTRGSSRILKIGPVASLRSRSCCFIRSASTTIVRNL